MNEQSIKINGTGPKGSQWNLSLEGIWRERSSIVYGIGIIIVAIALGYLDKVSTGFIALGLGCIGIVAVGRLVLTGISLLASSAFGLWKLAYWVGGINNLSKYQSVVLVVIVIGWCVLVVATLHVVSKSDDSWR